MSDTHLLWAEIEAAAPPPRKKRPESTPREKTLRQTRLDAVRPGSTGPVTSSLGDPVYVAPDNDRKMKEASWISSQAWFEALRYYPKGEEAIENQDCEATFSGNTHGASVPTEHIQTDVRNRVGIAAADPDWMPSQLPEPWAPEMEARLRSLKVNKSPVRAHSPVPLA